MSWAVTLIVNGCQYNQPIAGALVTDGVGGGYTDSYGQFIAVIDDAYTAYIVQISKSGYQTRAFTFDKSQVGKVQTTCLNVYVPPPPPPPNGPKCFIVTAATGSARSDQVVELRALRDRVIAAAPLAGRLIDAIYGEYACFSPAIAEQVDVSETLRMGVLAVVVRPLFAWYRLAGQLAFDPVDEAAVRRASAELVAACPRYLGPLRVTSCLRALVDGDPLPSTAPALAVELAPRLREAMKLRLASWAIFNPLLRTWGNIAAGADTRREIAGWLATAPLESLEPPPAEQLDSELRSLGALLAFDARARGRLGSRLREAWPATGDALERAGMLDDVV